MSIMMMLHQIKEYNNAGVLCMQSGMTKESWVFFKGALELHLVLEKARSNPSIGLSRKAAAYIHQAETRYQQLVSMNLNTFCFDDDEESMPCGAYHLALLQPRTISDLEDAIAIGVTIIFNLALAEHWKDPSSPQVMSMYGLCDSLLGPLQDHKLQAAIQNNKAIWYFENGDAVSAEACLERVKDLLDLDQRTRDQINSNLLWIAANHSTSAAA